jgi:hypothetical protein
MDFADNRLMKRANGEAFWRHVHRARLVRKHGASTTADLTVKLMTA